MLENNWNTNISCLLLHKSSWSLTFTMSPCPYKMTSPESSSQQWYNWRIFFLFWHRCSMFKHCPFLQKCVPNIFFTFPLNMWTIHVWRIWFCRAGICSFIYRAAMISELISSFAYVQLSRWQLIIGILNWFFLKFIYS